MEVVQGGGFLGVKLALSGTLMILAAWRDITFEIVLRRCLLLPR
jgi:hypothetical protein